MLSFKIPIFYMKGRSYLLFCLFRIRRGASGRRMPMNDEMKCFRERVFGPAVPREEVMRRIYESPSVYPAFERLYRR